MNSAQEAIKNIQNTGKTLKTDCKNLKYGHGGTCPHSHTLVAEAKGAFELRNWRCPGEIQRRKRTPIIPAVGR